MKYALTALSYSSMAETKSLLALALSAFAKRECAVANCSGAVLCFCAGSLVVLKGVLASSDGPSASFRDPSATLGLGELEVAGAFVPSSMDHASSGGSISFFFFFPQAFEVIGNVDASNVTKTIIFIVFIMGNIKGEVKGVKGKRVKGEKRRGDGETGRRGDGETGRRGDGETGKYF